MNNTGHLASSKRGRSKKEGKSETSRLRAENAKLKEDVEVLKKRQSTPREKAEGVIVHSNQSSTYASRDYRKQLAWHHLIAAWRAKENA
ncbi:MAG: hypothetical protein AB8B95_08640 [Pseudohongiellaceae bacterium]